ncbi:PPE domain-containing protein [Actinokineospora bangkokensis]|nr:PPE domain-containing protein [Actinokineospora bangkokensis]
MHRWEGYDHPALYKMINGGPGPAASTPQTEYWDALATELAEIDGDLGAKLAALSATWEGDAADQARSGMTPLQAWAADAQTGATGMRASTEYQADVVGRARAEMPEPVPVTTPAPSGWDMALAAGGALLGNPGPAMAVVAQAEDHEAQEAAQDAASQKAVDTMNTYQSSTEFNTATLGTFVPPPDVVISTPPPDGGTGYQVGYAVSAASGANPGAGSTHTASYTPTALAGTTPGHAVTPSGSAPAVHTTPHAPAGAPSTFVPISGSTTPSGYSPATGGAKPITGFTGTTPTAGGTAALPGESGTFRGGLPIGTGGPGAASGPRGLPGTGVGGADEALARRTGGGATGLTPAEGRGGTGGVPRGGMAGAGALPGETVLGGRGGTAAGAAGGKAGLGAGAVGGRGAAADEEEDFEHTSYLVEYEDIFGDERHIAPGVLGSDK